MDDQVARSPQGEEMNLYTKIAGASVALALGAAPAFALPSQAPSNQGTAHAPSTPAGPPSTTPPENQGTAHKPATPGPHASLPAKAKAYGKYCRSESKKHVKGEKGTPFSKCVTAMAKLANGSTDNPRTACKGESKKHLKGEKGTPFSKCVSAGAKLLEDKAAEEG
jgi:hypothetical protein